MITARYLPEGEAPGTWWAERPVFDYQIQRRGDPCGNLEPGRDHPGGPEQDRGLERRSRLGQAGAMAEVVSPG